MRYVHALLLAAIPGLAAGQRQQAPPPPARGAASITTADVRRRIYLIADDSMLGRATPSHELDVAAAYVASEFRRFGLKPGGDSGTYVQRYPLDVLRFEPESASIRVTGRAPATWRSGQEVLLIEGQAPEKTTAGAAVLITGSADGRGVLDSTAVAGKVVFLAVGPGFNALAAKLLPLRPLAVMLVAAFPDTIWRRLPGRTATVRVRNPSEGGGVPVPALFAVRSATVAPVFAQGGALPDSIRAWGDRPLAAHPLSDVALELDVRERLLQHTSAPNVVGILEGSDAALSKEYVLFTAHLDHIGTPGAGEGCVARGGDSICNGADDDGSGSVAVLELAQAFASARERPKRSLVFMTVSGEERGLWGSAYFADHPTVPLASIVADLNSDMVGRNAKDTLAVIGREQS
ncbi:MAG TPA: M28 family peptidase, partial [Gemmatimonadales bacterium]|nr:M28 family peptidase [Gemmatimonadales bacterium]